MLSLKVSKIIIENNLTLVLWERELDKVGIHGKDVYMMVDCVTLLRY